MEFFIRPEVKVVLVAFGLFPFVVFYYIRDIVLKFSPKRYREQKDIKGQTVLITGAGSGIGRELAIQFSKHSMFLVLMDLNKTSLSETEKMVDICSKTFLYQCDVSKRENVYKVAKEIKNDVGKVDILVNNAGIVSGKMFMDLSDEEIVKTIEVNTLAHFWMLKAFLPDMMEANNGHIVSIASQAGLTGLPRLTDYCASKFGAVGLMESLQLELELKNLDGVKTTIICPGLVSTGLFEGSGTPLAAFLKPQNVANEVIDAVLENKDIVMLPKWNPIILVLKFIMPTPAVRAFYKYTGMRDFMTTFRGRTSNESNGDRHQLDTEIDCDAESKGKSGISPHKID